MVASVSERALRTWFDKELFTETGIRNTVFRNESSGRTGSMPNAAVDALVQRFLLRTELRGGGAWLELVHDRFVEPIRVNNAAWFPAHLSTLQRQADLWRSQGRPDGLLLSGEALVEAERWADVRPERLEPHEREFLTECQAARTQVERERRQSRRIRLLAAVAFGVAVFAIIAAVFAATQSAEADRQKKTAIEQQKIAEQEKLRANGKAVEAEEEKTKAQFQTRRAQAGELAARAQVELNRPSYDPSLALLLASRAVSITWPEDGYVSTSADSALLTAVENAERSGWQMNLPRHRHAGPIESAALSPDGKYLLTASWDQTARIWDAATGQEVRTLSGHTDRVNSAAYSPDGRHLVTASGDLTARIWDVAIEDLLDEAKRLIQRDPPLLTPEERQRVGLE